MKRKCVFKCQLNKKWYYVYECEHPAIEFRTYYQTYMGRKRLDRNTWSCLGSAIGSILRSLEDGTLIDLVQVWK